MTKYKIIIVENDEDEQLFMKEGFDKTGLFDVLGLVNDGHSLMEWLEENKDNLPEIILSDLNMPGKNGYDIIKEIKESETYSHIPVIITSTSSTKVFIDKCLAIGAADYIVKPETFVEYEPYVKKLHHVIESKILVR